MSYSYDTFENEAELSKIIEKMQAESINHMKRHDAWEVPEITNPIKSQRELVLAK